MIEQILRFLIMKKNINIIKKLFEDENLLNKLTQELNANLIDYATIKYLMSPDN